MPEILPEDEVLEVRFRVRPVDAVASDQPAAPQGAYCQVCEQYVTLRSDRTCPLGHEVGGV